MKSVKELYKELKRKQKREQMSKPDKLTKEILKYIEKAVFVALEENENYVEILAGLDSNIPCELSGVGCIFFHAAHLYVNHEMELDIAQTLKSNSKTYTKNIFKNIKTMLNDKELGYKKVKLSIKDTTAGKFLTLFLCWDKQ